MKKIKFIIMIMIFSIVFSNNYIYASFADYSDEDAEKETNNLIQQHEEQFDSEKSDNNYLKELKITGGTLSPNFDRQTLEYTFKVENETNKINITAISEDSSAKVNGAGEIEILEVSECKIEVIAESGTTRTYFIKIIKQNEEIKEQNNTENEISENETKENEIIENTAVNTNTNSQNFEQNTVKENLQDNNTKNTLF